MSLRVYSLPANLACNRTREQTCTEAFLLVDYSFIKEVAFQRISFVFYVPCFDWDRLNSTETITEIKFSITFVKYQTAFSR